MEKYVSFITQNWILSSSFILVLLLWMIYEFIVSRSSSNKITPGQAVNLINHQSAIVLDLRSQTNFMAGHILDSINIPANTLEKKSASFQKYSEKPVIVIVEPGQDSGKALKLLEAAGLKILVLKGGLQSWREASLPVTKK